MLSRQERDSFETSLEQEARELLDDKVKSDAEIEAYEAKKELEETNDCE